MNRLIVHRYMRLLLSIATLLCFTNLQAQSTCEDPGDMFTLTYTGPDTFFVNENNCMDTLLIGTGSILVNPTPSSLIFSSALTGYNLGSQIPSGTTVTMHYIVSGSGVSDTLCFDIVFTDSVPPQMNYTVVGDTVSCDTADYATWVQAQLDSIIANATDNCNLDSVFHDGPLVFLEMCGEVTVTFYVRDDAGNLDSQTVAYVVQDNEPPVLSGVPADVFITCTDLIPPVPLVTAMDNCAVIDTVIFSQSSSQTSNGSCNDFSYTIIRTWYAEDDCGNSIEWEQVINVEDVMEPDFDVPADITITCDMDPDTSLTGSISNITDNCDPELTVAFSENIISGACPQEKTIVRTWTLTDACLNSRTRQQTITMIDTIPPSAGFPADITVDCAGADNLNITGKVSNLVDNCDSSPQDSIVDVIVGGSCPNSFTIYRTWTIYDDCGNAVDSAQVITVTDTQRPQITNQAADFLDSCTPGTDPDSLFNEWVAMSGSATATDNCTNSTLLTWSAFISGTSDAAYLASPGCGTPDSSGIYRTSTVDFVVMDECGNTDTTTAKFTLVDQMPPILTNCPPDITVSADAGLCSNNFLLSLPSIAEDCGTVIVRDTQTLSEILTIPLGSDPVETPVNDVVFQFSVPGPPYAASGTVPFTFTLHNVDAEAPTEFLNVYGENDLFIGSINHTPVQCGDTSTTITVAAALFDQWAFDGTVEITVRPNLPVGQPGRFSVNPICPGGSVTATLAVASRFPEHLVFEYSVNGGARVPVMPVAPASLVLGLGENTVTYYFGDCVGNESSCTYQVTVDDNEMPSIICPPGQNLSLPSGQCEMAVEIPLFEFLSDNCGVTTPTTQIQPDQPSERLITYSYNPNLNDFVADDKVFTFVGLPANATPGLVNITITIQGDIDSSGAYYQIYDPFNNLLGTTAKGQPHVTPGGCNTPGTATFQVPASEFNAWAAPGDFQITARSFQSYPIPPAGPGWGINPCDPLQVNSDGDTDGSYIFATISYESVAPTFFTTGVTGIGPVVLMPPLETETYNFAQGTTTVHYEVTDLNGNQNECTFDIVINDNEAPMVLCGPTFVEINPSGFVVDTILASEVDQGSFDNCAIASMTVSPNTITCNSPSIVPITLTVEDLSGNVSTCNTFVGVSTKKPQPTVMSDCGSSDLQLFANPPSAPGGGNVFQYTWINPLGQPFAFVQNPVILNASTADIGFYTVQITGITGCQSVNSVQVTCDLLPLQTPSINPSATSICQAESLTLSAQAVCGTAVMYKWYSGLAPNGMLMATTANPSFTITPPASGSYNFYMVVVRNGCNSAVSNTVSVQVKMKPVAVPEQSNFVLCEGGSVLLKSINNAPGTICHWTGPCGFESNSCSPAAIANVTTCNTGIYQFVVTTNGCVSDPAFVSVNIVPIPPKPTLTNSTSVANPACNGSSVTLTASAIPGVVSYQWTTPMQTVITTPTNILNISAVDLNKDAGQWTVKAIGNPCESQASEPTFVYVAPLPEAVSATANPNPACEGLDVQLSANTATQNVSYLWKYPDNQTEASQNPALENVTANDEGTYSLTVTTQFGCTALKTVFLDIFDRVKITGASSDAPACPPGPVDVHLAATLFPIDPGNYQYLWSGPMNYSSSSANAVIPGATEANSGTYTLVVTNQEGCSSLPYTVNVTIPKVVVTPSSAPSLSGTNPFCEGDNLTLTIPAYPGGVVAEYVWNTPSGIIVTSTPSLTINGLGPNDSGAYTAQYRVNNCLSGVSATTMVSVNPIPVVQAASNSPVCEGDPIQLNVNCTTGAAYEWTGPNFNSSICTPVITNADPAINSGLYTVRKRVNGCWSAMMTLAIDVKEKPSTPVATNTGPFCATSEGVMLSVTANSHTPGATYTWHDSNGIPIGSTPALNFSIPNPLQYGQGDHSFYVVATVDGCESDPSVPTVLTIFTIPNNEAEAGANISACEGDILQLSATPPTVGTGLWTLDTGNPTGVVIANPDQATTTVSGLIPGLPYTFRWSLSNGTCENYSSDTVSVFVNEAEVAEAGEPINACFTATVNLSAAQPISNIGVWTQPTTQAQLGVVIVNPFDPHTAITGLTPGNQYLFTWTIDGGCGSSSDVVQVAVSNESAFAGANYIDCGDGCTQLNAVPALSGVGLWSSSDPDVQFVTPTVSNSVVCNLQEGVNVLVWTINGGACGHHSVDSVLVEYYFAPDIRDDAVKVKFGGSANVNAIANDLIPGAFTFQILQPPAHGIAVADPSGNVTYTASISFIGEDQLLYEVCAQDCACELGTIVFNVGEEAPCDIPSIITPNHDGINDAFIVPCLSKLNDFTNNKLGIFNIWGDEVFHASPYRNDWEGTFDGEDLPAGTYYYVLHLGNGQKPVAGYLVIQR